MFKNNKLKLAFLNKIKFSIEKVEKVLNPPQKPTAANKYKGDPVLMFSGNKCNKKPRIILLAKLDNSVAQGNIPEPIRKVKA